MSREILEIIKEHANAPGHASYEILKDTPFGLYVMITAGLAHYGLYRISEGSFERLI